MAVEVTKLSPAELQQLTLCVTNRYSSYVLRPVLTLEKTARVPFSFPIAQKRATRAPKKRVQFKFAGTLRPAQVEIAREAHSKLETAHAVLLATHVGFGKTVLALSLLCSIHLKTIIVVNRLVLIDQWKTAIAKYIPSADADDIQVVNICNLHKLDVSDVGAVILDEVHMLLSKEYCKQLLHLVPVFLIGLSATPYRYDESTKLFDLFFGDTIIFKPLMASATVRVVRTQFKPRATSSQWGAVLEQQARSRARNALIVDILEKYRDKTFLVLCKRIAQIRLLEELCTARGIPTTTTLGEVDRSCSVLIGTAQKLGVGFDAPERDALIIAADLDRYFIQYVGRVFRKPDLHPLIFDVVDPFPALERHFEHRRAVYTAIGCLVEM
jgi:superfamily II DNA or RNA helicase